MSKNRNKRWRDYRPSQAASAATLNSSDVPLKLTFCAEGERQQNIDFSFMKDRPQMASLFARTMWAEGAKYAAQSRTSIKQAVRCFHAFIKLQHPKIRSTKMLTKGVLMEWAVWMAGVRKHTVESAANRFSCLRTLLKAAKSLYPEQFRSDFEIPIYIFSRTNRAENGSRALSEQVLKRLTEAAEREAGETRKNYREGDVPRGLNQLIPFMVIIAVKTAINPQALYSIRRDCLIPHVVDANAFYMVWKKLRSKDGVQRQLHYTGGRGSGVIELIRFLIAFTQPLVHLAHDLDKDNLFLYRYSFIGNRQALAARKPNCINRALKAFCLRNNLPYVRMFQLRPSAATHYYKKTGKLRKVQLLLGHAEISTTVRYIGDSVVQSFHNESIRAAQDALLARVTTVIPKEAKQALTELTGAFTPEQVQKITHGEYDTGICKCRNPFDSPQPGQHKGQCCTLFLACLTCPNALFFLEELPRVIALRNYLISEKQNMRSGVWDVLYRDRVEIIETDIIGAFSEIQIAEAQRLSEGIRDLPVMSMREAMK